MEKYRFEGKKEESLLENALNELKCTEEDVIYHVHEEKAGLLKSKKYIIELIKVKDVAEYGKTVLNELLSGFNLKGNIEIKIREKQITYVIHTDNNGILIGKKGHILDSLQLFVKQTILNQTDIYVNVIIDIENYKEKQNYFLEKKVKKIAREVALSKIDVKLDPMNSYERRIVHNAISGFDYVESLSEGEEPNRCVVIKYKEKKEK